MYSDTMKCHLFFCMWLAGTTNADASQLRNQMQRSCTFPI